MPIDDVPSLANPMAVPRRRKRSWSSALENLSVGLGHGMANNLQGIYELGTDPYAGTQMLEGLYQMGSRPVESAKALGSYAANALTSPLGAGMFLGEMVDPGSIRNLLRRHPMMQEMTAYHGSPHKFDKFELSDRTIGTGEGAQAYGHGLYFAENPDVAKGYARKLGNRSPMSSLTDDMNVVEFNGKPLKQMFDVDNYQEIVDLAKAHNTRGLEDFARERLARWENYIGDPDYPFQDYAKSKAAGYSGLVKAIQEGGEVSFPGGITYHVDIPDEQIAKMLDWDKPLSEQPEAVRKALEGINPSGLHDGMEAVGGGKIRIVEDPDFGTKYFLEMGESKFRLSEADAQRMIGEGQGQSLYRALKEKFGGGPKGEQKASEYLRSLGIPGIRYLDGTSRKAGEGTRNFVVFDDSILKILNRE